MMEPPSSKPVRVAKDADAAVVVAGLSWKNEGEFSGTSGGDRLSLALPKADEALIRAVAEANPHTIVIVEGAAPS